MAMSIKLLAFQGMWGKVWQISPYPVQRKALLLSEVGYPQPKDEVVCHTSYQFSVVSFQLWWIQETKELSAMLVRLSKSQKKINEHQYAVTDNWELIADNWYHITIFLFFMTENQVLKNL